AVTKGQRTNGGQIRVRVRPVAGGVEISVADNGCGINQEEMAKIFTPFFTTKPVGKGTGLGLSVCYGIIDKMGGRITVKSEAGRGATFTILLPVEGLGQVG
ncbi:MAG: HAMP domain-containing histidine kinase, partial [Deltaproteobacteria bacterium]|nr:HAMP domain-containing histidine kinase [Deltaproteobacteria bacterium]